MSPWTDFSGIAEGATMINLEKFSDLSAISTHELERAA